MGWLIPVRVVFLLVSAILVLGRPTLGLVATLRGSSFSFSCLGNLVLLFHFSFCTDESADLLVLTMTFAFLRYSDTSSFITFLRMGSSFALSGWKMLIATLNGWCVPFYLHFPKGIYHQLWKQLHCAWQVHDDPQLLLHLGVWSDLGVWWSGIAVDVDGVDLPSSTIHKLECSSYSWSLSSVMNLPTPTWNSWGYACRGFYSLWSQGMNNFLPGFVLCTFLSLMFFDGRNFYCFTFFNVDLAGTCDWTRSIYQEMR